MKLNQFARLTTTYSEQIKALQRIKLLDEGYEALSVQALAQQIFARFFPEAHSKTAQNEQMQKI